VIVKANVGKYSHFMIEIFFPQLNTFWLVVSTPLKNMKVRWEIMEYGGMKKVLPV